MFTRLHTYHDDKAYVTVRMCRATYQRLRRAFNADEEFLPADRVRIKGSAMLVRRGFGWYRLLVVDSSPSVIRIKAALVELLAFFRRHTEDRNFQIRQLLSLVLPEGSLSTEPLLGTATKPAVVARNKLEALATKFNSRRLQ